MNEFLNSLRQRYKGAKATIMIVTMMSFFSVLGIISLLSDIGFSNEITTNRKYILIGAVAVSLIVVYVYNRFWNRYMRWPTYYNSIKQLKNNVYMKYEEGGIRPNFVIGVNQGGALIGGLLYYMFRFFFTTVWTDQSWSIKNSHNDQKKELLKNMQRVLKTQGSKIDSGSLRILIVDDSYKTGSSMEKALALVEDTLRELEGVDVIIKTAVIVYRSDLRKEVNRTPDYYIHNGYEYFPYSKV